MSNKIYGQAWFIDKDPNPEEDVITVNGKEIYKPCTSLVQDITIFSGNGVCTNETKVLIENIWDQLSKESDNTPYPGDISQTPDYDNYTPSYKKNDRGYFYWEVPMSDLYNPETIEKILVECPKPYSSATFVNEKDEGLSNFFFVYNENPVEGETGFGIYIEGDEDYDPLHPYKPYEELEPYYTPVPQPDPENPTIPCQDPVPEHWVAKPIENHGTYVEYWSKKFVEAELNYEDTIVIQKKEVMFPAFDYDDQEGNKVGSNPKVVINNDLSDIENLLTLF